MIIMPKTVKGIKLEEIVEIFIGIKGRDQFPMQMSAMNSEVLSRFVNKGNKKQQNRFSVLVKKEPMERDLKAAGVTKMIRRHSRARVKENEHVSFIIG